jgi:dTDP-4-dehydrorhamnose reductase
MNQKILLIGNNGQLGQELEQILTNNQLKVRGVGQNQLNLTQPDQIRQTIQEIQPNLIINCAAYTAVDKAETEPELAQTINSIAPGIIANEAQKIGAFVIHISTDYVFDGTQNKPYQETDITNPLSIYGKSKLAGEQAIIDNCHNYLILRTAWVYGKYGKGNFVKTMLKLGQQREVIKVVNDQIGSPTWTKDLALTINQIIPKINQENITGIYHYTNHGIISWYDFALAIFAEAKLLDIPLKIEEVIPITTAEYPTLAKRPAYSVLSCNKITQLLGNISPNWRVSFQKMLTELYN